MEHNSSFNKQLRKETAARAVLNKKIKMLKVDVDVNKNNWRRYLEKSRESKKPYVEGNKKIKNTENFLRELMS